MRPRPLLTFLMAPFLAWSLAGCSSGPSAPSASTTTAKSTTTSPPTTTPSSTTTTAVTSVPTSVTPTTSGGTYHALGSYLPLYPFDSPGSVAQWQAAYQNGGHQPWHLDAGQTALAFAAWLGYTDVDAVISTTTDARGAHVSVGFRPTSENPATSAVVHLVRWGGGTDIPWEVVGTDDTTLSLTTPAYGATITSPVNVGGRISGVDENLGVQVRDLQYQVPLGRYCCLPAGGTDTPWMAQVNFAAPSGTVLTIAAQTGGHVAAVERFAVTGVRRR